MMNKNIVVDISCIIPIYNSKEYLDRAIVSLIRQSFENWEAICVDDGSIDGSIDILEKYHSIDSRIKIIKKHKNEGSAAARNTGLKVAKGKYVIFLDSDDYYYSHMLSVLFSNAERYNADLVIYSLEQEYVENIYGRMKGDKQYLIQQNAWIDGKEMTYKDFMRIKPCSWDKFIRRNVLIENNIEFQLIPTNDDILFSYAIGSVSNSIVFLDDVLYKYYFGRKNSLTQICVNERNDSITALIHSYFFICEHKPKFKYDFLNYILDDFQRLLNLDYSIENMKELENQIKREQRFIGELSEHCNEEEICIHNQFFVERLLNNADLIGISRSYYIKLSLLKIFNSLITKDEKIALWGCGNLGKEIIDIAENNGIKFDYVIDQDENKQRSYYKENLIMSYEEISKKIDCIIPSNYIFRYDIVRIANDKRLICL